MFSFLFVCTTFIDSVLFSFSKFLVSVLGKTIEICGLFKSVFSTLKILFLFEIFFIFKSIFFVLIFKLLEVFSKTRFGSIRLIEFMPNISPLFVNLFTVKSKSFAFSFNLFVKSSKVIIGFETFADSKLIVLSFANKKLFKAKFRFCASTFIFKFFSSKFNSFDLIVAFEKATLSSTFRLFKSIFILFDFISKLFDLSKN